MAIKKTLRSRSLEHEMATRPFSDRDLWDSTMVEDASPAPSVLPRRSSVDACGTRGPAASMMASDRRGFPSAAGGRELGDESASESGESRYVSVRWSDIEELHFMLNALDKERKRLEEKLAQMADVLEENRVLRATIEVLERERKTP